MLARRSSLTVTASALAAPLLALTGAGDAANAQIAALERHAGGRLGVFAVDTGNGRRIAHRENERFPMCSTFKLLLAGAVLARVDQRNESLGRRVTYGDADMVANSPVTRPHLALPSMTVAELCAAAIEYSDNTAANLLLHSLLGPAGVTKFARRIGDTVTRLDRNEPAVNTAIPGDPRDTSTPAAMARDMISLQLGARLSPPMRARLKSWLLGCKTDDARLRAGLPATWRLGAKTGSGDHNTANELAFVWPPGDDDTKPIIVVAYFTGSKADDHRQDATLAAVGRIVSRTFRPA
jgi:beta-lactamase class A